MGSRHAQVIALSLAALASAPILVLRAQTPADTGAAGPRPDCLLTPMPACIFTIDELTEKPDRVSTVLIPPPHRPMHTRQSIRVVAIIDTLGHIEHESVAILATTDSALSDYARELVLNSVYRPGTVYGKPVRVRVVIPIDVAP